MRKVNYVVLILRIDVSVTMRRQTDDVCPRGAWSVCFQTLQWVRGKLEAEDSACLDSGALLEIRQPNWYRWRHRALGCKVYGGCFGGFDRGTSGLAFK